MSRPESPPAPTAPDRTAARPTIVERVLGWTGEDDPSTAGAKALAFRRILLVHLAAETWFRFSTEVPRSPWTMGFALLFTVCLGLGVFRRWTRSAGEVALAAVAAQVVYTFPYTANHMYLELCIVLFVALCDPDRPAERRLMLDGLRWLAVIVCFYSGLKKLWYGYYFDASFFGNMIVAEPRFADFFGLIVPAEEMARLDRISWPSALGGGPFAVDSPLVVALSNATWILELLLPIGLLLPRLRRWAGIACLLTLLCIELAAREAFFGALYANLLLLFWPRDLNRRLLPLFVLLYALLTLITVGLVPRWGIG